MAHEAEVLPELVALYWLCVTGRYNSQAYLELLKLIAPKMEAMLNAAPHRDVQPGAVP